MLMYLVFGDPSGDGHCQTDRILVEAPSMEHVYQAKKLIQEEFGKDFFDGMAHDYGDSSFSQEVWEALFVTEYPLEYLEKVVDYDLDGITSVKEFSETEEADYLNLDVVMDAYIWLLNWAGAKITKADPSLEIPEIWSHVGYGCYD